MRLRPVALAAVLAAGLAARAADPEPPAPPAVTSVKLPDPPKAAEVRTPVGVPVRLSAGGKAARWEPGCESAGKSWHLIPDPDGKGATVVANKPGRFLVLTTTAAGDVASSAARTCVVAGEPDPEPPAPVPPQPPAPPSPPVPADPFRDKLRAAYAADAVTPDKADKVGTLAELYKQAAKLAADDKTPTAAALVEQVRAASVALGLTPADLAEVRKLVAAELAAVDSSKPFDAAARAALAAVYRRASAALAGLS